MRQIAALALTFAAMPLHPAHRAGDAAHQPIASRPGRLAADIGSHCTRYSRHE